MVPYELTISHQGEQYTFIGRFRADGHRGGPLAPVDKTYVAHAEQNALMKMLDRINRRSGAADREEILSIGRFIDERILPGRVRQTLGGMETSILILTDDPRIPWELAGVVGEGDAASCIGERVAIGRCLMADSERTGPAPINPGAQTARALFIADPLCELDEAQEEARALSARLEETGWRVDTISGRQATYDQICEALTSGRYAVVHFCCDVEAHHTGGAIPTATPDAPLAAGTVRRLNLGVQVVYLNACGSAVHDQSASMPDGFPPLVAGMAHAFIEAGGVGVVGSVWKIEDRTSRVFADSFYSSLLNGESLGAALLHGKQNGLEDASGDGVLEPGTTAGFVLYGNPDMRIALPGEDEPTAVSWPAEGVFAAPAAEVLRQAAAAARSSSALTSLHLGWALLARDDSPLAVWMRECGHPLGNLRSVAAGMIDVSEDQVPDGSEPVQQPSLSPTLSKILEWAEDSSDLQPVTLEALTDHFLATQCMFLEVLEWLCIDPAHYPETRVPLPLSPELEEALASARDAARWNDGLITSLHLLLGILEVGGGPLPAWMRRRRVDVEAIGDNLRSQLLRGSPDMSDEQRLSLNSERIMTTAQDLAIEADRGEVLLDDVVEAASELDAGGFGRFLKEIRYGRSEVELTRGPAEDAAAIEFTTAAEELLDRAAQCAEACGHAVIGTPHVLTAALQDYAPLRSAVAAQGVDPAEVLDRTLQALGAPNAEETFAGTPQPRAMPPSPNCGLALSRAQKRSESLSPLTVADLLIAILTQTTSKAAVVLQALGVETYDLVRRIDSTP